MAVANGWGVGQAIPVPQFGPNCCSGFLAYKSKFNSTNKNLSFVLNWGCSAQTKSSASPSSSLSRNRKSSNLCCRCSESNSYIDDCIGSSLEWDWNRWSRHFSEIEQAESFASVLKFQLEDAIEKEDFQEAAKLKMCIAEATSKDTVAEIMSQLKNAIEEERYHDASRLCKYSGSGLVGWWVGYPKDSDDPFGRLIRITPGVGRFVGKSYSPRQLVTASPGSPLFEIFVVKNADGTHVMQVVYLHQPKANSTNSAVTPSKPEKGSSTSEVKNATLVDVQKNEGKAESSEEKGINIEGATEEGIKSVINFLKKKIPGLKVKVMDVDVAKEVIEDENSVNQLMQENSEKSDSDDSSEDEVDNLDEIQPDEVTLGEGSDTTQDEKDLDMKLFIGGVVHNDDDAPIKDEYVRRPAEIKDVERDSFVLHIPGRSLDHDTRESKASKVKVAALAAKSVSELMPSDVAKAFWNSDKVSPKVTRNMREIVKLAVSQAQKRSRLSEYTTFNRISTSSGDLDPFDGLYVGAFGPYGTEVVQLRRKYGHWNGSEGKDSSADVEFFEYVEAVKLTGDLNVPAGQVTFRAKIGKGNRLSNRGMYPDELGVVASYKGQGRIAEFGFRNPQWVEGELLQLSAKGIGPYVKGADLGFLYIVPEQSFLVLFNRLKLPE
ncbi:protein EXECUTER 2, chloroplastic [Prunus avium]|uniref:Protein EXECUTER 2, chloroplastic n=1 Tax=Prunus avium TaxID=42229 RepID=A0A6P5TFH3_PRUAV|nr:protein EXECUTER 2, chloroplastic [Prunus avium]